MYAIEKLVPMPEAQRVSVYPWKEMKAGDSFVIPAGDTSRHKRNSAMTSARQAKIKVMSRTQPDGSIRIWRIA